MKNIMSLSSGKPLTQLWGRSLSGNRVAILLLNRQETAADITVTLDEAGFNGSAAVVEDAWSGAKTAAAHGSITAKNVPRHGAFLTVLSMPGAVGEAPAPASAASALKSDDLPPSGFSTWHNALLVATLQLVVPVAAKVTVESVVLIGEQSPLPSYDTTAVTFPDANKADNALVLCTANGAVMQSKDGGKSFEPCDQRGGVPCFVSENAIATGPAGNVMRQLAGAGVPSGYTPDLGSRGPLWRGPWASTSTETVTKSADGTLAFAHDTSADAQSAWGAPPHNSLVLFSLSSGGVTALDATGKNFLATPWLWYSDAPLPKCIANCTGGTIDCCNGSVVAYVTSDAGRHWTFRSEIASKKTLHAAHFSSEEGPNENSVVMLKDKKTLFVVMRKDGGDGVPHHNHALFVFATSTDIGHR